MGKQNTSVLLVGGGGHALVMIDACEACGYEVVGILEPNRTIGSRIGGVTILGDDSKAQELYDGGVRHAIITMVGNMGLRKKLTEHMLAIGYDVPTVVNAPAFVSSRAALREGVTLLPGCMVGSLVSLHEYVTVNTGATVEHECTVGSYTHVAPHATVLGACTIGSNCSIGAGSVLLPGVSVGNNCVIGAGAVILHNVPDDSTIVGNPGRLLARKDRYAS